MVLSGCRDEDRGQQDRLRDRECRRRACGDSVGEIGPGRDVVGGHARYATASRMRSAAERSAAASGPSRSSSRDTAGSSCPGRAPAKPLSASGRPPCAPTPGTRTGPWRSLRSGGSVSVAPTTTPTDPGSGSAVLLTAAAASTIDCATVRPSTSARCTEAPSGLEVAASTKTPRPCDAAVSRIGCSEPKPKYGETVTASAASGDSPAHASAYAAIVEPMSPRLASASPSTPWPRTDRKSVV